jgi:hypothetical protein
MVIFIAENLAENTKPIANSGKNRKNTIPSDQYK